MLAINKVGENFYNLNALDMVLEESADKIGELIPKLERVIKDKEDDFLYLGNKVFSINSKIKNFSQIVLQITELASEEKLESTSQTLERQKNESKKLFDSILLSRHSFNSQELLGHIKALDSSMRQFKSIIRTLKMLEIATRIESSYLSNMGSSFITLADDVKALALKIAQNTYEIYELIKELEEQIIQTEEEGRKQVELLENQAEKLFPELSKSINQLEDMQEETINLSQKIKKGSEKVAENMGKAVSSVQFHDITRQQVEHIESVLDETVKEIRSEKEKNKDKKGFASWVRDILNLQLSQLGQSRSTFYGAVITLIRSFEDIASDIEDLNEQSLSLTRGNMHRGNSVLDSINLGINQLISIIQKISGQLVESSQSMNDIGKTITRVSEFIEEISDIGTEIELIALNANVKSAHTGEHGQSLSIIALEIQELSVRARKHASDTGVILDKITETAQKMILSNQNLSTEDKISHIEDKFKDIFLSISDLDENLQSEIMELGRSGEELFKELSTLISSINFHNEVSEDIGKIEGTLDKLNKNFAPFKSILENASQPEKLKKLLSNYTMESERLVHLAVLENKKEESISIDNSSHYNEDLMEDDFGDNIELF